MMAFINGFVRYSVCQIDRELRSLCLEVASFDQCHCKIIKLVF